MNVKGQGGRAASGIQRVTVWREYPRGKASQPNSLSRGSLENQCPDLAGLILSSHLLRPPIGRTGSQRAVDQFPRAMVTKCPKLEA